MRSRYDDGAEVWDQDGAWVGPAVTRCSGGFAAGGCGKLATLVLTDKDGLQTWACEHHVDGAAWTESIDTWRARCREAWRAKDAARRLEGFEP